MNEDGIYEAEAARSAAHSEYSNVCNVVLKNYQSALKGLKCSIHGKTAYVNATYQYQEYDDGNYTRIYLSKCCCSRMVAEVTAHLESEFSNYVSHRVYEHSDV